MKPSKKVAIAVTFIGVYVVALWAGMATLDSLRFSNKEREIEADVAALAMLEAELIHEATALSKLATRATALPETEVESVEEAPPVAPAMDPTTARELTDELLKIAAVLEIQQRCPDPTRLKVEADRSKVVRQGEKCAIVIGDLYWPVGDGNTGKTRCEFEVRFDVDLLAGPGDIKPKLQRLELRDRARDQWIDLLKADEDPPRR